MESQILTSTFKSNRKVLSLFQK